MNRITFLRKELNLTQVEFAKVIGFTQSNLSAIEQDKTQLTDSNIRHISLAFCVNSEWLKYGTGEMFSPQRHAAEKSKELVDIFLNLSKGGQQMLLEKAKKILEFEKHF